ncbi:T9SS type A sorting domain-containing protein [Flavobacterium sp. XS2P14]|uniref:T9SS type A sorting domain-containing protein n=1 Tax=Flavobacterium sp. XS2P14 TaxID=3401735 RepID=UPI003AAC1237
MKKTLILIALIITTFAIAKNIDDSNIKSLVGPTAPRNFVIKPLVDQYYNANTFIWDAGSNGGTPYKFFTIYLKRSSETVFRNVNVSITATHYTLTDEQMPMPMNYALYVTATDVNGNESPPSNYTYYAGGEDISPKIPSLVDENVYNASTEGFTIDCGNSTSPDIVGYFFYANDIPVGFSATSINVILGLNPNTSYKISVAVMNQYGNMSAPSATVTKTTLPYCAPPTYQQGTYDVDNYIKQVELKTLKYPENPRTTVTSYDYNNFSNKPDVVVPKLTIGANNSENILKVMVANKSLRDAIITVTIDYNYNGVFEPSEIVPMGFLQNNGGVYPNIATMSGNTITSGIPLTFISAPFTVPVEAYAGKVKMRIAYERYKLKYTHDISTRVLYVGNCDFSVYNATGGFTLLDIENYGSKGEMEDFDVELVQPAPTATRNALSKDVVVQELKNNLSEKPNATNFVLYPNPVSGDFMNISLVEDNTPYRIINMLGQEVGGGNVKNGSISVAKLNTGNYFIEINNKDQRIVKRFIKQ